MSIYEKYLGGKHFDFSSLKRQINLRLDREPLVERLIELAENDECDYVRLASVLYLIREFPNELFRRAAQLYESNLDSDLR